ncbi:TetR/AcrR family transcriptional regulator [Rhizobium lusitanum]|uniref:TetR/AcrR family transcriptional regulator n=1 Tax=Rhizobium lusitanum TaxID=293958 RepID=UPI00195BBB6F|nr:TetR/AcrR family transcriptional regulator [Rhizobium lusitanum]MBM7049203.1 TetR family transcriptional regulator [Rhizobium lusitanum]
MSRWKPNAEGRFRAAAMELFIERSYEQTTVADIAERAGLTPRTFFRHFADKREVLFNGSARLQEAMLNAVRIAPAHAVAIDAIVAALEAMVAFFGDDRASARLRRSIVASTPELRERELIKLATLSATLAEALHARGINEPDASLAAEAAIAVFRVAFAQWLDESEMRSLDEIVSASLDRLRAIVGNNRWDTHRRIKPDDK